MKRKYDFFVVTISFLILFVFCMISASYEFEIRDEHRFLNDMPFSGLNYFTGYIVIFLSFCLVLVFYLKGKGVNKKQLLLLAVSFVFVVVITIRNYIYYSNELEILKGCYTEEICLEELEERLEKKESIKLYVNSGTWEEAQQGYEWLRTYAYGEQVKIYMLSAQNKPEYFPLELKNFDFMYDRLLNIFCYFDHHVFGKGGK